MNIRKINIIGILLIILAFSGCWRYGSGQSTGYIYAVDDGISWDKVWFKPNLASTESDCYLINSDSLKSQLRRVSANTQIKIYYERHLFTWSMCGDGNDSNDEIISFEVLEG